MKTPKARVNRLIARFVKIATGLGLKGRNKNAAIWRMCKLASDRAKSEEERKLWRAFMGELDENDDRLQAKHDQWLRSKGILA